MEVKYYIEGVDFSQYGVRVADSVSTIGKLKMKEPFKVDWHNYHGGNGGPEKKVLPTARHQA